MATSEVEIWNHALRLIGKPAGIEAPDELSEPAEKIRDIWPQVRDDLIASQNWGWARRIRALSAASTAIVPPDHWAYVYIWPSDGLSVWRILGTYPQRTLRDPEFEQSYDPDTKTRIIYSNQKDAVSEYTQRMDNVATYPPSVVLAMAFSLASSITGPMTGGVGYEVLAPQTFAAIERAKDIDANQFGRSEEPTPRYIVARRGSGSEWERMFGGTTN